MCCQFLYFIIIKHSISTFSFRRKIIFLGISTYQIPMIVWHYLRCHQKMCVTFSVCGVDLVFNGRRLWRNYESKDKKEEIWPSPMTKAPIPTEMSKGQRSNTNNATKKYDFMKRTLIQCLHRTCSSTHTWKKHKKRPISSWTNSCPATFEGLYTSVLLIFLELQGFKVQNVITVTCHFLLVLTCQGNAFHQCLS